MEQGWVKVKRPRSTDDAPANVKRRRSGRKFVTQCKRSDIPMPKVSVHEGEHLDACEMCQELWPLFLGEEHYQKGLNFDDVCVAWSNLGEKQRELRLKELRRQTRKSLKQFTHKRYTTAYQFFLAEKSKSEDVKNLPFGERTNTLAKIWKTMSSDEKAPYQEQSDKSKMEKKETMDRMPTYQKRIVAQEQSRQRSKRRKLFPKKPLNSFMLFMKDYTSALKGEENEEQAGGDRLAARSHKIREAAEMWAVCDPEVKARYEEKFAALTKKFQEEKKKIKQQLKEAELKKAEQKAKDK